jgi:hypothetical protein
MVLRELFGFGKHIVKTTKKTTPIFYKHKFGIGDPCIRIEKGSGHEFVVNFFTPDAPLKVVTEWNKKPKKRKKRPLKTYCLFAKKYKKRRY